MAMVDVTVLNPKSMQISELYGAINTDTLEFSDGMVRKILMIEKVYTYILACKCYEIVFEDS